MPNRLRVYPYTATFVSMATRKVTMSLPDDTLAVARSAAETAGMPFSSYVARALRNETLRRQMAGRKRTRSDDEDWMDLIEADAAPGGATGGGARG